MAHTIHPLTRHSVNFGALLSKGWEILKARWQPLLMLLVISFLVNLVLGMLKKTAEDSSGIDAFAIPLLSWIVSSILAIGWLNVLIRTVRNEKVGVEDLYAKYNRFFPYFLGSLLVGLIVAVGLVLLVIPGIIFALKYMFVPYLLVDKKMGVFEALKASGHMTNGFKWRLFGYGLGFAGINILGALALGVGLAITVPISTIAYAVLYNALLDKHH